MVQKDVKMEGQVKTQRERNTTLTSVSSMEHTTEMELLFFCKILIFGFYFLIFF
jgi:hypothetical protein